MADSSSIQRLRSERREAYREVSLKGLGTAVRVVAADLTRVADIETMQLVQPIRYRLAVPA